MAGETPNLRLPSQPQRITASRPVPIVLLCLSHMCVNNLPKVVTRKRKAGSRTHDHLSRKSNSALTVTLPTGRNPYVTLNPNNNTKSVLNNQTLTLNTNPNSSLSPNP